MYSHHIFPLNVWTSQNSVLLQHRPHIVQLSCDIGTVSQVVLDSTEHGINLSKKLLFEMCYRDCRDCSGYTRGKGLVQGGGGLSGDNFDGDNFGRGKFRKGKISPPAGILKLAVIFWWALDGSPNFLQSTFKILGNTAFQCIPVTQPPHVANKHIFLPSLRLVHWCTFLNSQHSPASEFAVKLLVTRRENFAGGRNFATFLNGEVFLRNSALPKFSPPM